MQVNDYVMYGTQGICKVEDVVHPDFAPDKKMKYFVLSPVENASTKAYVPVSIADERCRPVMSKQEAAELIVHFDDMEVMDIQNDREREIIYRKTIEDGRLTELVGMLKNIYSRNKVRKENGKKITAVDEKYFKIADENLCRELAFALDISNDEVREQFQKNNVK